MHILQRQNQQLPQPSVSNSCPQWPCPSSSQDLAEEAFRTSRMWTLGQEVKQSVHYSCMDDSCGDEETAIVRETEMRELKPISGDFFSILALIES